MQVNCLHPVIIINPLVNEYIAAFGNIVFRGRTINFVKSKRLLYEFKKNDFLPDKLNITPADCDSCYILDSDTGEHYPLYLQVPCGHCEICKNAKVNAFVERCKLETQMYNSNPLFITLTYDELHKKECGVCLRDFQLFFKRLRINLYRRGYRQNIRYALVSEYGRRTSRPHGHAILWNLHQTDILSYCEIRDLVTKSWSNGFCYIRQVDPSNDKAFYYTAKYLRKDCNIPSGCNKTFLVCSNRGGAIGSSFLDLLRDQVVKRLNTSIKYVNKWNGRTFEVQVNRYMLNRLVPSLSRALPYSLKCRVRRFVYYFYILKGRDDCNIYTFAPNLEYYIKFFNRFFFVYDYGKSTPVNSQLSNNALLRQMLEDDIYIQRALSKGQRFYDDAVYYSSRRQPYLDKVFAHVTEQDMLSKCYDIVRRKNLSHNYEIL